MKIFSWLLVTLALIILILFGCAQLNQTAANKTIALAEVTRARGEAQSLIIQAQGQARLDSAQATATTQAANLPYLALGIASIFGVCVLALAVVLMHQNRVSIRQIERIETRIIFLPTATSRRDLWRLVSDIQTEAISPRNRERINHVR